jgi:hypothetical protein
VRAGRLLPLAALEADEARRLAGLVFDLDDTVLDHGELGEAAYSALFRMREAGLRLVVCTGRPAGWGELIARQWPVDAVVAENGGVAFAREAEPGGAGRLVVVGAQVDLAAAAEAARARRAPLLEVAAELRALVPATALADDNSARWTDVTLDIGEHRRVSARDVAALRAAAAARGVRTFASSVHVHLTREPDDKASGALRVLHARWGDDPTRARAVYAFAGDSGNDAAAFAAFETTFGVANVRAHLSALTIPPRYVTERAMGAGFAEIATRVAALRARR